MPVLIFLLALSAVAIVIAILSIPPQCPHCKKRGNGCKHSWHLARGYNHMCEQANGANGWYCGTHSKVYYDEPNEKYLQHLPCWCTDEFGVQGLDCDVGENKVYYAAKIAERKLEYEKRYR